MLTNAKIIKSGGSEPDQFEISVSQALFELEVNSDLKSQLRELHITRAKEIETNNKKVKFYFLFVSMFFNMSLFSDFETSSFLYYLFIFN